MSLVNFLFICVFVIATALLVTSSPVAANGQKQKQQSFPGERFKLPPLPLYGEFFSNNYAGEINVTDDGKLTSFFWFVEAEVADPSKAPLLRFFTGGPNCASMIAFLTEIGPYLIRLGGEFVANDWRWTKFANVLVMDSPAGVGFSKTNDPFFMWNDTSTAEYNLKSQQKFLNLFPQFKNSDFYLTGESYGGRYLPTFAEAVLNSGDQQLISSLKGLFVGNPCTGFIGCQNPDPTLKPYFQQQGYLPVAENVPMDPQAQYNPYDLLVPTCQNDQTYTVNKRFEKNHPVLAAYGQRKRASFGNEIPPYGPCAMDYMTSWLNRADVKKMINAPADITFVPCANQNYDITNVSMAPIYQRLAKTTKMNLGIYSGLSDSVVNHAQTETIIHNEIGFPLLKKEYQAWSYPYPYNVSQKQLGGFWLEYDRFSFAGVIGAGHEVPQYQPAKAYELIYSFVTTGRPGRM